MTIVCRQGYDAATMAFDALERVFVDNMKGRTVLVKPNIGRVSVPGTGVCTDPEVVRGVVRFFVQHGAGRVLVGDGPIWGVDIWKALEQTGIRAVCAEEGVECVDMDAYGSITIPIPHGVVVDSLKFSALIRQVDCIVSVPVMKTHMYTGATLGIKNMKGCLYKMEKTKLHRINKPVPDAGKGRVLDYGIADMASVVLPDYTVVDGTIGLEGLGPSVGSPRPVGVVLASKDVVACDVAALRLMGMQLEDVPHLRLIAERQSHPVDVDHLSVEPADFLRFAQKFEPASLANLKNEYPNIHIAEKGTCSACSAALMVFVRTHGEKFVADSPFTLATGKDLTPEDSEQNADTFFIGNCAARAAGVKGRGYCQGCPPVGSSILAHIRGQSEHGE